MKKIPFYININKINKVNNCEKEIYFIIKKESDELLQKIKKKEGNNYFEFQLLKLISLLIIGILLKNNNQFKSNEIEFNEEEIKNDIGKYINNYYNSNNKELFNFFQNIILLIPSFDLIKPKIILIMRIQNLNDSFIQIINGGKIEKKNNINKIKREILYENSSNENINTIPFNKSDFDIEINTLKNINSNISLNQNNDNNKNEILNNKKIDNSNKNINNKNNIQLNNKIENNNKEIYNNPNININNNYYITPKKYKNNLLINNSINLNKETDDNSNNSNNNIIQNNYLRKKTNPYFKSQNLKKENKTIPDYQDSFNILHKSNLETIISENPSSFEESYIPHNISTDGNNPFLFDFIKLEPSVDKETLKEKSFPVNQIKKKINNINCNKLIEPINLEFQNFTVNNNNNNSNNNNNYNNNNNNNYYNNNRNSNGINSKLFNYNKIALIYNENEFENHKISKLETAKKMISNKKEYINDNIFQNNKKNIINKNEIDKIELKNIINKGFYPKTGISSDNTIKNNNDNITNSILAFGTPQRNNNDDILSLNSDIIQKNYYNLLSQKQEH